MSSKRWKDCKLEDICVLQRGFDLPIQNRENGNYPIVASNGIVGYHNEPKVKAPGVVIGRSGNLGDAQYLEKDFWPLNTTLWVKDFNGNIPEFVFYFLKTYDFKRYNAGSGVPTLNRNHIHPLPAIKPPIEEQKNIAKILGSIDRYILANLNVIDTLQKITQSLFKAWFNDYEFNNNKKPEKWVDSKIGQIISNKSERIGENIEEASILSAVKTGDLVKSDEYFTKQVYSKDTAKYKRVDKYDFAYNPARINIGSIGMNEFDETGAVSPVYVVFSPKEHYQWFIKMFLIQERTQKIIAQLCSGSVRQVIDFKTFSTIELTIPPEDEIIKFNETFMKYKNLIDQLKAENETLTQIRDNLLPKLISGEVRVG